MIQSIKNSWALVKASADVLRKDKELLIFPIISSLGLIVLSIVFFLPFLAGNLLDTFFSAQTQVFGYLLLFLFYIVQYSVIFFANTALVGAAQIRLRGGDPTIADGLRIAFNRLPAILGYALIAATVGMIFKMLSRKQNSVGRIVVSLLGFAWNVATFLVVPVLVTENVGPITAIKNSTTLLKKTWGEQIVGNFGLGAFFNLIYFLLIFFGIALTLTAAVMIESWIPAVIVIMGVILLFILTGLVNSTLSAIYTAAVYEYASTGQSANFFDQNMVRNAFRPSGY